MGLYNVHTKCDALIFSKQMQNDWLSTRVTNAMTLFLYQPWCLVLFIVCSMCFYFDTIMCIIVKIESEKKI